MDTVTPGGCAKAEQLRHESGPGFANADLEGNEFEGDGDQPVRRLDDERGQERGRRAEDQPQREMFFDHPERVERQLEHDERDDARAGARRKREDFLLDRAQLVDRATRVTRGATGSSVRR